MKILYAVQATGNGHITRARIMAKAFKTLDIKVDWVFTGRPKKELFDMEVFGDFRTFSGLTFAIENGSINYFKTVAKNNVFKFIRDIYRFDFNGYDRVINDFEPITAWSAKLKGIPSIGISHQMAFNKNIPIAGKNILAQFVLKHFAPVTTPIGLHWNDFEQDLLPPVIDEAPTDIQLKPNDIIVYFPFCSSQKLIEWFAPFPEYNFHIFHGENKPTGFKHIHLYHFSRTHFQTLQKQCSGVITAAGFELPSEAIQLGQKMLLVPLANQMEQQSNAHALNLLMRATIINEFSTGVLKSWLKQPTHKPMNYPNVAYELVKWLVSSERESLENLSEKLWQKINSEHIKTSLPTTKLKVV